MSRKLPIRTYQRKNIPNSLIKNYNSIRNDLILKLDDIPKEQHGIDNIKENKISEDSLDYDPFETTFDKIAKDAVVPPIPSNCIDDKSWYDSSFDNSYEKQKQTESLFHVSIGTPNTSINSDTKCIRSRKKTQYDKEAKEKNKKIYNTKIISKSKHAKESITLKKESDIKVHKKKKEKWKVAEIKENKSTNTGSLYFGLNSNTDKLYEHTANTGSNEKTNSENGFNTDVSNSDIHIKKIDLFNSGKSKLHIPFRETTNILNIYDKKETRLLKSINKNNDQNFSVSESHRIPSLIDNFKIKPCSIILNKDNIETNIVQEHNKIITLNDSVNTTNKSCMNDVYFKDNAICSTPISTSTKRLACSNLYSPINTTSSIKCIASNTNKNILHTTTHVTNDFNISINQVQSTDLHVLNQISTTNSINAELCTNNEILYEEDSKKRKSTSVYNLPGSKNKVDEQEQNIPYLGIFENNSNFISNRERYNTIFMDDSICPALRQNLSKTHQENKSLLNFLNTFVETDRSRSLFNDSESKHFLTNDANMSSVKHKSFTNMNAEKSDVHNKLKLELSALDIYNDEKIIQLEIPKQKESCELITITKEESIEKFIEKENENIIEEKSCDDLRTNQNQPDMNETQAFFTRLQDSVQVTKRRKQDWKRKFHLSDIHENGNDFAQCPMLETSRHNKKVNDHNLSQNSTKHLANASTNTVTHYDKQHSWVNKHTSSLPEKFIFLKPGKFWTRSLSILHNFQNGLNLNETSVEKGRKWRHSVQDILDMQKTDLSSSYGGTDQYIDKLQLCNETQIKSNNELTRVSNRNQSTFSKRLTRRVSVRVVRDSRCIQNTDDTSFLEVYGICTNTRLGSTTLETSCIAKCNTQYNDKTNNYPKICSSKTARKVVLQRCFQEDYLPFRECVPNMYLKYCRKIGEGVYGEVFLYEKDIQKSVLKIIPIEGDQLINGEPQKKFNEILSEIVIAKELHNLRSGKIHSTSGFVEVKSIKCIKGKYPEEMINSWKSYDNEKTSDNDCPSIFDENQLYIALELGHGGQDLESFEFPTAFEAHTLFIQTALALAVAERSFKFEHRDLHWGNILISYTAEQYIYYKLDNKDIFFPSNGVKVCIIDFTLSRMSYQGCCIYNDLAQDPALFTAQGEYQFEIYRLMRDKIQNNWQEYEPYTNILWLHYILDKMVTIVRYKKKSLRKHKNAIMKLQNLKQVILSYQSSFDFVNNCDQITSLVQGISA